MVVCFQLIFFNPWFRKRLFRQYFIITVFQFQKIILLFCFF